MDDNALGMVLDVDVVLQVFVRDQSRCCCRQGGSKKGMPLSHLNEAHADGM